MEECIYCRDLNEEKENIQITGIHISKAGHYNYYCPLKYCPVCGTILNKYK